MRVTTTLGEMSSDDLTLQHNMTNGENWIKITRVWRLKADGVYNGTPGKAGQLVKESAWVELLSGLEMGAEQGQL